MSEANAALRVGARVARRTRGVYKGSSGLLWAISVWQCLDVGRLSTGALCYIFVLSRVKKKNAGKTSYKTDW